MSVTPFDPCGCKRTCGDDGDTDGPGVCKGLPRAPEYPLVEIVLVHRDDAHDCCWIGDPCPIHNPAGHRGEREA